MSAPSAWAQRVRSRVRLTWGMAAAFARLLLGLLWRDSWRIAAAQFSLEVEQARRASGEKGGRA